MPPEALTRPLPADVVAEKSSPRTLPSDRRRMRYPSSVTSAISKPRTQVPWKRLRTSTFVPGDSGDRVCAFGCLPPSVLTPPSYRGAPRAAR